VIRLCEFDEENLGGEIIDVGHAQGDKSVGELMRDDLNRLAVWQVCGILGGYLDVQGRESLLHVVC
jgi:hypothetical protein